MSAFIEVFMDWFDLYELRNFGIHTDIEHYTQAINTSQDFLVEAVTNITEGEALEIALHLHKKDDEVVTKKYETYVTNGTISDKFRIEDLVSEANVDINDIAAISAVAHYEDQEFKSNNAIITRILQSKEFKHNGVLNDMAEKRVHKAYKKTTQIKEDKEVKLLQKALKKMKINTTIDGKYGNDTKSAVETFQSNYKPTHQIHTQYNWLENADGIVGRNTLLAMDEALVERWEYVEPEVSFPLAFVPVESYKEGMRKFGSNRASGKRKHAGCDLYAPVGSKIFALDDGVILEHKSFYLNTNQITIKHTNFIARYGEVKPNGKGIVKGLKVGSKVKKGQHIGYVGELVFASGTRMSMLHLELYSGTAKGPLTDRKNLPYQRRSDLIDPTSILDKAKNILPRNQ